MSKLFDILSVDVRVIYFIYLLVRDRILRLSGNIFFRGINEQDVV